MKHQRTWILAGLMAVLGVTLPAQERTDWVASFQDGAAAFQRGRYQGAVRFLTTAAGQVKEFPAGDLRRIRIAAVLAMACHFAGETDRAEKLFLEAKNLLESGDAKDAGLLAFTLDGLGELYQQRGNWQQAEPLFKRSFDLCASSSGATGMCAFTALRHLGELHAALNHAGQAEAYFQRCLDAFRENPALTQAARATILRNLGGVFLLEGDVAKAEPLLEESLRLSEALGDNDAGLADCLVSLGRLRRIQHDPARALPLLNRAVRLYETSGDSNLASALHELGLTEISEGKYALAR